MNTERITERCSSSCFISRAKISGYKLVFNKRSKDKSGKANLVYTGDNSLVWGVIFDISEDQKTILDAAEGLGRGYDEYKLQVINDLEQEIECVCYIATDPKYLDDNLKPYDWYRDFCLLGAKEHNLPKEWILTLEQLTK
jgi:hypothetical protein